MRSIRRVVLVNRIQKIQELILEVLDDPDRGKEQELQVRTSPSGFAVAVDMDVIRIEGLPCS